MSDFASLVAMNSRLVAAGFHDFTPWWRTEFEAFYRHPTARLWAIRAGRGSAKSFNAVKFALNETLFGNFHVPPGERHFFCFVSIRENEALERLRLSEAMLTALRVRHERKGETIELLDLPLGLRVFTCNVGSNTGLRCPGWVADESAKWNVDGRNPAAEVLASIRAMTVTHPNARGMLPSSPLSMLDLHYQTIEHGTDATQYVSPSAPTWVANPSISEEETHLTEPNLAIWSREYAAIPNNAIGAVFDHDDIERCFLPLDRSKYTPHGLFMVMDPSSLRNDAFVLLTCRWMHPARDLDLYALTGRDGVRVTVTIEYEEYERLTEWGYVEKAYRPVERHTLHVPGQPPQPYRPKQLPPVLRVEEITTWEAADIRASGLDLGTIVRNIVELARQRGVCSIFSDDREEQGIASLISQQSSRLAFKRYAVSGPSKEAAVESIHRLMRERSLSIVDDPVMRRQLHEYSLKWTRTGHAQFSGRGPHDDRAAALILLAHTMNDSELVNSYHYTAATIPGVTTPNLRFDAPR